MDKNNNLVSFKKFVAEQEELQEGPILRDIGKLAGQIGRGIKNIVTFNQAREAMEGLFFESARQYIQYKVARKMETLAKTGQKIPGTDCYFRYDKDAKEIIETIVERERQEFLKVLLGEKDAFQQIFDTAPGFKVIPNRFFSQWWESTKPVTLEDFKKIIPTNAAKSSQQQRKDRIAIKTGQETDAQKKEREQYDPDWEAVKKAFKLPFRLPILNIIPKFYNEVYKHKKFTDLMNQRIYEITKGTAETPIILNDLVKVLSDDRKTLFGKKGKAATKGRADLSPDEKLLEPAQVIPIPGEQLDLICKIEDIVEGLYTSMLGDGNNGEFGYGIGEHQYFSKQIIPGFR